MSTSIQSDLFVNAVKMLLEEAFDNVRGIFLDRGTSLFETLADISAEQASIPVGGNCATLAAQVKHIAFYLDTIDNTARNPNYPRVDWSEIWNTVSAVTPDEWQAFQDELRANYNRILRLLDETPAWESEFQIGGAIAVVAHTAYHLGEIRQALCFLRQQDR